MPRRGQTSYTGERAKGFAMSEMSDVLQGTRGDAAARDAAAGAAAAPRVLIARRPAHPPFSRVRAVRLPLVRLPLAWREALLAWCATRLLYAAITCVLIAHGDVPRLAGVPYGGYWTAPGLLGALLRWDIYDGLTFFLPIAVHGYVDPNSAAFFPLYPLLIRAGLLLTGRHSPHAALVIGLILSNVAALATFAALAHLARRFAGTPAIRPTLVLFAAYPLAFFLAAPYSDAPFLAFALWSLVCAGRRWWGRAAVCAFCAALTRPTGMLLVAPLLAEYLCATRFPWHLRALWAHRRWLREWWALLPAAAYDRRAWARAVRAPLVLLCAVPAAIGTYAAYCAWRWGRPLAFIDAERGGAFRHTLDWPWHALFLMVQQVTASPPGSPRQARQLVDLLPVLVALIFVALIIGGLALRRRALPPALAWWLGGLVLLCLIAPAIGTGFPDVLVSDGRYLVAAFPIPLLVARHLRDHRVWLGILAVLFLGLQCLLLAVVLSGSWLV